MEKMESQLDIYLTATARSMNTLVCSCIDWPWFPYSDEIEIAGV